jgi:cyanophycin synthetase
MRNGGRAAYVDGNSINIYDGANVTHLIELDRIPITIGGIVECNIENSLAAVCSLYCLDIPLDIIRIGLLSFKPDVKSNPGRFNIFDLGEFRVMLDYGHNPAGYRAVLNFIRRIGAKRYVGIIGMPGDRPDRSMREVGAMCGKCFSKIYIKEDEDLRGRNPGEVAQIFLKSVMDAGMKKENIKVILPELKALETAVLDAEPGDLVVMFYEKFEPAVDLIEKFSQELKSNIIHRRVEMEAIG